MGSILVVVLELNFELFRRTSDHVCRGKSHRVVDLAERSAQTAQACDKVGTDHTERSLSRLFP